MKRLLFVFLSLLTTHQLPLAQVVSTATDFIVAKKYSEANHYLDSLLKKNAKCTDCLMMKGNIALNAALDSTQPMEFISEEDESVFNQTITEKPKLLSKQTVYEVEKYWKKCLKIDSSRVDVRKGLCSIYAMALMKDSLKRELPRLRRMLGEDSEEAFRMCEYARKFKERNRFNEAMDLYQFIAKLYPEIAGIRCDIASEYFYAGRMNETLNWLDSCYYFKTVDETSFLNGAFIYSELGYFDNAQNVLNTYSHIYQRKMDEFYYSLYLFSDSNSKCFETLRYFCSTQDSNAYTNEFFLAKKLLQAEDSFTLSIYNDCVTNPDIPDYYKTLIHARAMKQFAGNCKPFVLYGIYQAQIKNYSAASQFLEEGQHCEMKPEEKEAWAVAQAYTFYKQNLLNEFIETAAPLANSSNMFYRQASNYFTALMLSQRVESKNVKGLFENIIVLKQKTKYGDLAAERLKMLR